MVGVGSVRCVPPDIIIISRYANRLKILGGWLAPSLGGLLPSSVIPLYHNAKKYEFFGVVGVEKTIG